MEATSAGRRVAWTLVVAMGLANIAGYPRRNRRPTGLGTCPNPVAIPSDINPEDAPSEWIHSGEYVTCKEPKAALTDFRPNPHQQAGPWWVCSESGPFAEALRRVTVITAPSASLCASMLPPMPNTRP